MSGPRAESLARAALITPSEDGIIQRAGANLLARIDRGTEADFLELTSAEKTEHSVLAGLRLAPGLSSSRPLRIRVLQLLEHDSVAVRIQAVPAGMHLLIDGNAAAVQRLAATEWHARVAGQLAGLAAHLSR